MERKINEDDFNPFSMFPSVISFFGEYKWDTRFKIMIFLKWKENIYFFIIKNLFFYILFYFPKV